MSEKIVIAGSGAFGTALAAVATLAGQADVVLLCRSAALADELSAKRINSRSLPGIALPETIAFTADPSVLGDAGTVLFAMPSQHQRQAADDLKTFLAPGAGIICCAKGIEKQTGRLLTDLLEEELPDHPVSVLSGPGFAADIARGLPTAMVVASGAAEEAARIARLISGSTFRLYASTDRTGVQLGGALKNVLAIACGMVEGAGLGESARAALIARGLAEMSRLAVAMGGSADTIRGLSGLGDLVLTGTSRQSRNLRFGIHVGLTGQTGLPGGELVEGAHTASIAARLARQHNIEMPITRSRCRHHSMAGWT